MSDQKSIREMMTEYGYVLKGSCHCDGYDTQKYKKDSFELRWRKAQFRFRIFQSRKIIVDWTKVNLLEDHLKKLHSELV